MEFNRPMFYPSDDMKSYLEYLALLPIPKVAMKIVMDDYQGLTRMDKDFIYRFLKPAFDFIDKNDKPLYCGEYGVIDHTDMASREAYSEDLSSVLLEYGIGRAVWSYKRMGFTHIDQAGNPISEKLVQAVSKIK
jgi:hypothetical protein